MGSRPDPPAVRRPRVPGAARPAVRDAGVGRPRGRPGLRRARRCAGARRAGRPGWPSTATAAGSGWRWSAPTWRSTPTPPRLAIVAADGDGCYIDTATLDPDDEAALASWLADPDAPKALHEAKLAMHDLAGRGWTLRRRHLRHRAGRLPGAARAAQLRARRPVAAVPASASCARITLSSNSFRCSTTTRASTIRRCRR